MRYGRDRPLWKQRRWWQDGVVFALAFPLVLTAVDAAGGPFGGAGPVPEAYRGVIPEDRREEPSVILADRRWRRQVRTGTQ